MPTPPEFRPVKRSWPQKFRRAFWGIGVGTWGQSNCAVHITFAVLVMIAAAVLRVDLAEWGLLILCIAIVLVAEVFNSALERLAQAITRTENEDIAAALDIASGAVLVAALGAAVVGALVFVHRLWCWLQL